MKSTLFLFAIIGLSFIGISMKPGGTSKGKVKKMIEGWYEAHPESYSLDVTGEEAVAKWERYHPEREDEKDNLIRVYWKDMKITLAFKKPLEDIYWSKDSLQSHFSYVTLDNIYTDLEAEGWEIAPVTPQSSARKGLTFSEFDEQQIAFEINWRTYTVRGDVQSEKCQKAAGVHDGSLPESCFISIQKSLPLHIKVDARL